MTSTPTFNPEAAFLAIVRASEELQRGFVELFKAHDLSLAQYNVLRILKGAGKAGLTCGDVAGKLIRHDPDVTRLLDRLDRQGLITRGRDTADRRVVRTTITKAGEVLLAKLDRPVAALHAAQLGHISDLRLADLVEVLEEARAGVS